MQSPCCATGAICLGLKPPGSIFTARYGVKRPETSHDKRTAAPTIQNIFIFADPQILAERIERDQGRPSLTGEALENEIGIVWEERRDLYLKYADFVWDDTGGKTIFSLAGNR